MSKNSDHIWTRTVILGFSLIIVMSVVGFSMAQEPEGAPPVESGNGAQDLFGVRIPDADAAQLAEWGIEPLPVADEKGLIANVTTEQLERLRAEGVAFEELGRAAVITSEQAASLGYCYGANGSDYTIGSSWVYSYIDLTGCSVWSGAQVTLVYYEITYETEVRESAYCDCYDQLSIYLGNSSHNTQIQTYNPSCCPVGLQSEGEKEPQATYGCIVSGSTHFFDGDTVNQQWYISTRNMCKYGSDYTLDQWKIWVYYNEPTATPTPRATNTPTRTPTPRPSATPTCVPGEIRIHKWNDQNRDGNWQSSEPPLMGAMFTIYDSAGNPVGNCVTDASGLCIFSGCAGRYRVVETDLRCYESSTPNEVWVDLGDGEVKHVYFGNYHLRIGLDISKTLVEPVGRHAIVSDTVRFDITITNTGEVAITDISFIDEYDPNCLRFLGSTIPQTSVDATNGRVYYAHALSSLGGIMLPGDSRTFRINFHAEGYCQPAQNCIHAAVTDACDSHLDVEDCEDVWIDPIPCREAIQNGGFETGDFTGWMVASTNPMVVPGVQNFTVHGGNWAAVMGGCVLKYWGVPAGSSPALRR